MKISTVYIRFYKSFNFDYLRKYGGKAQAEAWEMLDGTWQPYVRVPLHAELTAVVGANESGKSHLLTAIAKSLNGDELGFADFCRYSGYFSVEEGKMRRPDIGLHFTELSSSERAAAEEAIGTALGSREFRYFRESSGRRIAYIGRSETDAQELDSERSAKLDALLPRHFTIDPRVPLPDSVPLRWLSKGLDKRLPRKARGGLVATLFEHPEWYRDVDALKSAAQSVLTAVGAVDLTELREKQYTLARDLMLKVAGIGAAAFSEIERAISEEDEGYANGLIQEVNDQLARKLNFPKWWAQDPQFSLLVSPREIDLVFTIRDRTGTEYSFAERSEGLKYFLSYYIQFLAHEPANDGRTEVLTMDEPDAYLSSQGQQDLLRIFQEFAAPSDGRPPVQVVYATHSPYLIDRNHADRIRVLQKGVGEEGTRVVRDVARNHYEPLRSAFGTFVAESTFIGTGNLMVEGLSDQVLLVATSSFLRAKGAPSVETLDLNRITIVPAGSASHIPYLVYLARGRDVDRPAVTVLLDSDDEGDRARAQLGKHPLGRQLLPEDQILQIGDVPTDRKSPEGIAAKSTEDLIPLSLAIAAARSYASKLSGIRDAEVGRLDVQGVIDSHAAGAKGLFEAVQRAYEAAYGEGAHIEKVGFAKEVSDLLRTGSVDADQSAAIDAGFTPLLRELARRLRAADRSLNQERVTRRLDRVRAGFLADHEVSATRENGALLIEELESALDQSAESDDVRAELSKLRREFELDQDLTAQIDRFPEFQDRLRGIKYAGQLRHQEDDVPSTRARTRGSDKPVGTRTRPKAPAKGPAGPRRSAKGDV